MSYNDWNIKHLTKFLSAYVSAIESDKKEETEIHHLVVYK